jgi:hypothetical protein
MSQRNPYAPPKAEVVEVRSTGCSRDGKLAVVPVGNDLPPRCIKCNAPVKAPIKEVKLYWHSPWLYLLVLINVLVYAVVGLVVRRTVKVSPGLCGAHAAQRRRRILLFLALGAGSCLIWGSLLTTQDSGLSAAFFILAILFLFAGALASRKVHAKKITKEHASVGGCGEAFLASLE